MSAQSVKSTVTKIDTGAHDSASPDVEEAAATATDETLEQLEDQLRRTADSLKESAKSLGDLASLQIQQRPLAAIGVAFLAGLAAAKLLRR
jgi:ElaB/YqjD/DUF883 family membrane-anchored ribosome-binding protein